MDNWKATLETLANSPGTLNCDPPTELINDAKRALEHIKELEAKLEGLHCEEHTQLPEVGNCIVCWMLDQEREIAEANANLAVLLKGAVRDEPTGGGDFNVRCAFCDRYVVDEFVGHHSACELPNLSDAAKELLARADDHDRLQLELEELYRTTEERVSRMVESHVKAVLQPLELETNAFYTAPDPESEEPAP